MNRFTKIQAVTFDVGSTLIEPWPSVGHLYAEVAARHGMPQADAETLNRQFAAAWQAKTKFDYSEAAWFELVRQTFAPLGSTLPNSFFPDLYRRFAEPDAWRVYDDVLPTLDLLAAEGLKLAAISNWDERLRPLLKGLNLDGFFETIVISGEIGFQKPSPVIFEQALRRLSLPAGAVLHVGDSASEDVRGAISAGLQGVLIRRRNRTEVRAGEIRSLEELPVLIRPAAPKPPGN